MIQVIDSIMGSGKTNWAIDYMNSHPWERFIFVTPFIDEDNRIVKWCEKLNFFMPDDRYISKSADIKALIHSGKNIATTHELFSRIAVDDGFFEDMIR